MNGQWAETKNRLGDVVDRALDEGPQRMTRRGDAVVVIAEAEYQRVVGERQGFARYLCAGPSLEGIDLQRDDSSARAADL